MEKTYNEVLAINNTLNAVSRNKTPFSIGIARNLKILETALADYNTSREDLVDKYVVRDSEGNIMGVEKQKLDEKGKVVLDKDNKPVMERVEKPQRIDETEWTDSEQFQAELTVLNDTKVDLKLIAIDVKKKYIDLATNKEMTIEQFLDVNFEAGLIIFLVDNGFLTGLDL